MVLWSLKKLSLQCLTLLGNHTCRNWNCINGMLQKMKWENTEITSHKRKETTWKTYTREGTLPLLEYDGKKDYNKELLICNKNLFIPTSKWLQWSFSSICNSMLYPLLQLFNSLTIQDEWYPLIFIHIVSPSQKENELQQNEIKSNIWWWMVTCLGSTIC